jgi:CubicO group peptidase (beta-lactamase class C family)
MFMRTAALVLALTTAGAGEAKPSAPPPSAPALCPAAVAAIDAAVDKTLKQGSPGMAVGVAHAGRVIFARGYGLANIEHQAPLTPDSPFLLASVTKQFTAAALLLLVQEGKVRLEDKLSRYLPAFAGPAEVTLYQLLVHTSGIPDYSEDPTGSPTKSVARTLDEMVAWITRLQATRQFAPGSAWAYSNSNYVLLAKVIEQASGASLPDFFQQRLFAPAGLKDTAFDDPRDVVPHRVQGYRRARGAASGFANADWISPSIPGAAGGLRTTINDLLRWSDALHGARIIDRARLQLMTKAGLLNDGRTTKEGMPPDWQRGMNASYGLGVFVSPAGKGSRIWHSGDVDGFSTWLAHYPAHRLSIALMENSQSADMDKDAIEQAVTASIETPCT